MVCSCGYNFESPGERPHRKPSIIRISADDFRKTVDEFRGGPKK